MNSVPYGETGKPQENYFPKTLYYQFRWPFLRYTNSSYQFRHIKWKTSFLLVMIQFPYRCWQCLLTTIKIRGNCSTLKINNNFLIGYGTLKALGQQSLITCHGLKCRKILETSGLSIMLFNGNTASSVTFEDCFISISDLRPKAITTYPLIHWTIKFSIILNNVVFAIWKTSRL